ncbi:MAG: galactose ABC transporter substrate-binding protein [Clostridium sp.]
MNRLKKGTLFLVTLSFLLGLTSCGTKVTEETKEIYIGVTLYKGDDTFINDIRKGIEAMVKSKEEEEGCKIIIDFIDANGSVINQENQIDRFISREYDVICVNLVDRTAAATIIDKAKDADIPLVFFNREPVEEDMNRWSKLYYVGAQAEQSARMQGNIVIKAFEDDGSAVDKNGDGKLQYVILEGELGHQDAAIRTEYCVKSVMERGIELERLADESANWQSDQSNEKMTNWIKEFENSIEVVFSNNDEMALGAIYALKTAEVQKEHWPVIVGVDGINEALEAVKDGTMEGTVLSDAKVQATNIVNIAYALAMNESPEKVSAIRDGKYVLVPHKEITKENIDDFIKKPKRKEVK